ncbi:MAG TPA: DUF1499 domain-containing protein [Leptolyngbyaceae cyanobacterium]
MIETKPNSLFKRVQLTLLSLVLVTACLLGGKITLTGEPQLLAANRPTNLGVLANQLAPCPNTPNCVNSQSRDAVHQIEPLSYYSSPQEVMAHLRTALQSFRRVKTIAETDNYLYTEFTIPVVGFVDDVEFLLDNNANVIHVRSASRLEESDLGVNRTRIETIRAKFNHFNSNKSNQPV